MERRGFLKGLASVVAGGAVWPKRREAVEDVAVTPERLQVVDLCYDMRTQTYTANFEAADNLKIGEVVWLKQDGSVGHQT